MDNSATVREELAGLVELTELANLPSGHAVKAELFDERCHFKQVSAEFVERILRKAMRRVRHIERIANLRHLAEAGIVTLQARDEVTIPHRLAKARDRHVAALDIVGASGEVFRHGRGGDDPIVTLRDRFHESHSTFRSGALSSVRFVRCG